MDTTGDRLYGRQTELAVGNFQISGETAPTSLIRAMALIKGAAARTNGAAEGTGVSPALAEAIASAAAEVADGRHDDQFPVDIFQTGSGTSTNMNVNEVIATLAGRRLGAEVHPNDHVNASQSTNDTFPSAIRMAALDGIVNALTPALEELERRLALAAREFDSVVKAGRTHLMDATPITLGQEFGGYRAQVRGAIDGLADGVPRLAGLPIGGTATGNGLNAPEGFGRAVADRLADETGLPLREAEEHFSVQGAQDALVECSGHLRTAAIALCKIANDLRWMASGPRTGLAEITLRPLQPGSSIMPGKVNPVICEVTTQVSAQVIGNDAAIGFAGAQGNFELNAFLPLIARNLLESVELLTATAAALARTVEGIGVNVVRCRENAEATPAIATVLNPHLGYEVATEVVRESLATGRSIRDVVLDRDLLGSDELDEILDVGSMARGSVGPPADVPGEDPPVPPDAVPLSETGTIGPSGS